MNKSNDNPTLALLFTALLALSQTSCLQGAVGSSVGGGGGGGSNLSQQTAAAKATVESAVSSANSVANDVEQTPTYAFNRPAAPERKSLGLPTSLKFMDSLLEQAAFATPCGIARFTPGIGASNCSGTVGNETVLSSFNSCTIGESNEFKLNGTISLTFDQPSTCTTWIGGVALPTSGSVTRTSSNLVRTNPDGSTVTSSSDTHTNYLGQTIQGGTTTNFNAGSRSITILGLHRIARDLHGTIVFNHSVYTTIPLTVTGTKPGGNRFVNIGTIKVDNNLALYSLTASLSGLSWAAANCCYPTSGTVNFLATGSVNGSTLVDFNTGTCGQVQLTAFGLTTNVNLAACE